MHKDFTFIAPVPTLGIANARLLERVKSVGGHLAGNALRSYVDIARSTGDLLPGLSHGRLHLPRNMLVANAGITNGLESSLPVQRLVFPDAEGYPSRVFCLLFTDRSMLIGAGDPDPCGEVGGDVDQVLPVVFTLPAKITLKRLDEPCKLSVKMIHGRPRLTVSGEDRVPYDLISDRPKDTLMGDVLAVLCSALDIEVRNWAREIERCPLIFPGTPHAQRGILGKDMPAPVPALEGRRYAWPAALPSVNRAEEELIKIAEFHKLAFTHLVARNEAAIGAIEYAAMTGAPRQDGKRSPIDIRLAVARRGSNRADKAFAKKLTKEYKGLLQHPKAPPGTTSIEGHTVAPAARNADRSSLYSLIIHHAKLADCQSRHERLRAYALFEGQ